MSEIEGIKDSLSSRKDVILIESVKRILPKGKEQTQNLVATESSLFFGKLNKDSEVEENEKQCWIYLISITVVDYLSKLILRFSNNGNDKEIAFTSPNYKIIGQKIGDHLQRLMGPIFALKLNLALLTNNKVNFDNDSVLLRLKVFCEAKEIKIPDAIMKKLETYLSTRQVNFLFSDWGTSLEPILFAIQPYQHNICGIINTPLTQELCEKLKSIVIPFKHICIATPYSKILEDFLKNAKLECTSMSFKNTRFDPQSLPLVGAVASQSSVQSLGMNNAFLDTAFDVFYTESVFKKDMIQSLSYLNIDNTKGIKLPRLLWFIKNITILSLANCGLEVTHTLNQLCSYDLPNLRCLNLSGNICQETFVQTKELKIPPDLCRIDVSSVEFSRGCAKNLFEFLFKQEWKYGARLYANNLTIPSGDIQDLFDFFDSTPFNNLVELGWCKNQTRIGLIRFLKKNKKLMNLFMDEDFGDKSPGKITEFANTIMDLQFLTILSVRGSYVAQMKESMMPIIEAIKTMINIAVVVLSGNIFDAQLLQALSSACNLNKAITDVIILNNSAPKLAVDNFVKNTTTKRIVVSAELEQRNYQQFPEYLTSDELISPLCQNPPYDTFIFMPEPPPEPTPDEDPIVAKRRKLFLKTVGHHEVDEDLLPIVKITSERVPITWELDEDIVEGAVFDSTQAAEDLEKRFSLTKLVAESK